MQQFQILQRQADYFLASKKGMHCKIVIDEFSDPMPLGMHTLHVEEVSERYQHKSREGIFKLTLPFSEQSSIDICTMSPFHKVNLRAQRRCLQLGGKWEPILNEWVFSQSLETKVRHLQQQMASPLYWASCQFKETITVMGEPLTLYGFPITQGLNSKLQPIMSKEVKLTRGDLAEMPGKSVVLAGSVIRLPVPQALFDDPFYHEDFLCVVEVSKRKKPVKIIIKGDVFLG